ncbi:hypothetical protein [Ramlibacter sp.]|uniref:hypothetical protein n=1 Tax=Ramlibacter sp. TaxID=1917967 RepID=UPI002D25F2AD|nr:hypothetical protein [Ramlibacter sp.]HYD76344.1 hypothetical protein [Ramlibacter sp.]
MSLRKFLPFPFVALTAGASCLANPLPVQDAEFARASSGQLRAAYLECDRVSAQTRVDQDFMIRCQKVADALRHRDFGGDFERQLRWWRSARKAPDVAAGGGARN